MSRGFLRKSSVNTFIGIVWILFAVGTSAQNAVSKFRADSIRQSLSRIQKPQDKIPLLKELIGLYWQLPEEVPALKEIIDIAMPLDSIGIVYDAMAGLSRYYYNVENRDSLLYWVGQLDSLASKRHESPRGLFLSGSLVCQDYLWSGNYELAMDKAMQYLDLARESKNDYGLLRAYRDLGMVYQRIKKDSDAVEIFGKGLHLLKGEKANPAFRIMYLSNMLESTLLLGRLSESEALLKQYDHLLDSLERKYNGEGKIFPVKRHRCLMSCYYCELYTMKGNSGKAQAYLDQATAYLDSSFGDRVEAQYLRTKSFYYWKEKDYRHALSAVNLALKINRDLDKLEMKKAILQSSGQLQEAVTIYEEIINKTETINTDAFDRQIEQLRVLNDLNDLEKQDRELKLKSEQEALKQKQIVVSIGLLLVLMGLLYMLWRIYMHTKRLRNELLQEKDSLIASEKQLRVVTKEAEAANKKKSAFIANISHEIRTPLNAIVGFSELISDESISAGEKKEFFSIINNNSYLLLNLINDILDLSRLESGNMKFIIEKTSLSDCCRNALASVEHRVFPGVQLTYTPSEDPLHIQTDSIRLQQLLINLLTNACKFTKEGEINLSYQIDEDKQRVRITVTDTGCGIPEDKQKAIFERFEKVDEYAQGTGLGLSISQTIIEHLGGSIQLDPTYKHGARFIVLHPYNPLDNPS